jgi:hypothetical protein
MKTSVIRCSQDARHSRFEPGFARTHLGEAAPQLSRRRPRPFELGLPPPRAWRKGWPTRSRRFAIASVA